MLSAKQSDTCSVSINLAVLFSEGWEMGIVWRKMVLHFAYSVVLKMLICFSLLCGKEHAVYFS